MHPAFSVVVCGRRRPGRGPRREASSSACSFSRHSASSHIRSSAAATGAERVAARAVEAMFVIATAVDEARGAERAELQRDGAERDVGHGRVDPSRRQLLRSRRAAGSRGRARRGDGGEDRRVDLHVINLDKTKMKSKRIIVVLAARQRRQLTSNRSSALRFLLCGGGGNCVRRRVFSGSGFHLGRTRRARRPPARNAAPRRPH